MKYKISVRFWGYRDWTTFNAKSAKHRDSILKELMDDYCITSISVDKVLKSGDIKPLKSIIIEREV